MPYDWWIAAVFFNTYVGHLVSRANMLSMWIPTTPHFLTVWNKELFFYEGGGGEGSGADWGIWRDAHRLFPSLFPPFFARSLFHHSLVCFFFAPPHWPRAWHRLLYSYFERNLDSADKFNRKQCDVMMTSHHVIVSIKLSLDVGNDEYIILLHWS